MVEEKRGEEKGDEGRQREAKEETKGGREETKGGTGKERQRSVKEPLPTTAVALVRGVVAVQRRRREYKRS